MRTYIGITSASSFAAISGTLWLEMSISLTGRSVGRKQLKESHIGRISRRSGNRYTSKRGNGLGTRRSRRNIGDMRMVCGGQNYCSQEMVTGSDRDVFRTKVGQ